MKYPHEPEDNAAGDDSAEAHDHEANAHKQGYGDHNSDFCLLGHPFSGYEILEVFLIELGAAEPAVKLFGGPGKAEGRQHQKGNGGQYRQHRTQGSQPHADAAQDNI